MFSLIFACLTVAGAATAPQGQPAGARTRDIYVSVVDNKGVAAPGLTASDFAVREDGVAREARQSAGDERVKEKDRPTTSHSSARLG